MTALFSHSFVNKIAREPNDESITKIIIGQENKMVNIFQNKMMN